MLIRNYFPNNGICYIDQNHAWPPIDNFGMRQRSYLLDKSSAIVNHKSLSQVYVLHLPNTFTTGEYGKGERAR